jgi:transposase
MRDTELYRYLLGIEPPWTVERVKLDLVNQRVDIWANHEENLRWSCPECGALVTLYDHAPERSWRHLDSCQFKTFLHARPLRVNCTKHGIRQVRLPWADDKARFTLLFERLAIDVLQESDILGATRILRISWDEAWHILERAVERGLMAKEKRICPRIGVDEKSVGIRAHLYDVGL